MRLAAPRKSGVLALAAAALLLGGCGAAPALEGTWQKVGLGSDSSFTYDGSKARWELNITGSSFTLEGSAHYDPRRQVLSVTDIQTGPLPFPVPLGKDDVNKVLKAQGMNEIPDKVELSVSWKNAGRIIMTSRRLSLIPTGAYTRRMEDRAK